ncbi:MAG: TonB-dependent receptor [Candidatus Omnitrophica bacterium]|nr:TonB-dependent receptor [Candidatus Omnitrophota bacterium]
MKKIFFYIIIAAAVFNAEFVYAGTDENGNVDLERIVVTPIRMEQSDYEATSNVTVIGSKEIKSSHSRNIPEVLMEKAGLNVYNNSSDKTNKVDIRGFADTSITNVLVLIDGRKINPVDTSAPDWLQIPVESIERIEVVRGAGSVLYGDNAVGGVINIITKKGAGKFSGRIGTMMGSYKARQDDIEIQGQEKQISYYIYSKYYSTEGYRANNSLTAKDANARVDFDATDLLSLGISGGWHKDNYGMPGGLDDQGNLNKYGRRGSAMDLDYALTKDRYVKLSVEAKPQFHDSDLGKFTIDYSYRNRDAFSWFYYDGYPMGTSYSIDTRGVTVKDVYDKVINGRKLNIVTGVDYYDIKHTIRGSEWNTDDLSIYKDELGFYNYSGYEAFKNLFLNGGARYQKAKYRFDQKSPSIAYITSAPSETVFDGGMKYEYAKDSNVYLDVKETFRFLATDEWYSTALPPTFTAAGLNTNLKQQTGIQYEFGIKHNFHDLLTLKATPYWIDIDNEIYVNPTVYPGNNENYPKTRRKGIELGLKADLLKLKKVPFLDKFEFFTNYTYLEPKFRGGVYNNKDIPMVPRQQYNSGISAGFKNYDIFLAGRFIGDRYAINDTNNELSKVKSYFVLDGKLSYKKDFLEIYAGINNIFSEKYSEYVAKSTGSSTKKVYYPAPERSFELGAIYKW